MAAARTLATRNKEWGFYGTTLRVLQDLNVFTDAGAHETATAIFRDAERAIMASFRMPAGQARDLLDSTLGRHIAWEVEQAVREHRPPKGWTDTHWIVREVRTWRHGYKPEDYNKGDKARRAGHGTKWDA